MSVAISALLMAAVLMVMVFPSATLWTAGGLVFDRLVGERPAPWINVVLALLLATTVIYIWL